MPQTNPARPKHSRTRYFLALGLFDGLKTFADLEARIAALPTEKGRGDGLRGLCCRKKEAILRAQGASRCTRFRLDSSQAPNSTARR